MRRSSPAFDPNGKNAARSLKGMKELAVDMINILSEKWDNEPLREILRFCKDHEVCKLPERLCDHLVRVPRAEDYIEAEHSIDKGDWLADFFFESTTEEIGPFV